MHRQANLKWCCCSCADVVELFTRSLATPRSLQVQLAARPASPRSLAAAKHRKAVQYLPVWFLQLGRCTLLHNLCSICIVKSNRLVYHKFRSFPPACEAK